MERRGLEQRPFESVVQRPNHYATRETNFLSTRLESSTVQFTPPTRRDKTLSHRVGSGGVNRALITPRMSDGAQNQRLYLVSKRYLFCAC